MVDVRCVKMRLFLIFDPIKTKKVRQNDVAIKEKCKNVW